MARTPKKEVVVRGSAGGSETATPGPGKSVANWRDSVRSSVQDRKAVNAALPTGGGNFISLRGGQIIVNGAKQKSPMPVVVLATLAERTYYEGEFQPGTNQSPTCYAYAPGGVPHPSVKSPVSKLCATCEFNEFGSARNKKGKACKEGVKLAVMHTDSLRDVESALAGPIMQVKLSVQNAKIWVQYANGFDDDEALWQYVTHLGNENDEATQYRVSFMREEIRGSDALFSALARRETEAKGLLTMPYPSFEEAPKPTKSGRARKFQ